MDSTSKEKGFVIRRAEEEDSGGIWNLSLSLAKFAQLSHNERMSEKRFKEDGFGTNPAFRCFVAQVPNGGLVGYALYYDIYASFEGPGIYLEELFVEEGFRNRGIGKALLQSIVTCGADRGANRVEYGVLQWNEEAQSFYSGLGAVDLTVAEGIHVFVIQREAFQKLIQTP